MNAIEQPRYPFIETPIEQKDNRTYGGVEMRDGDRGLVARSGFSFNTETGELIIGPAGYMFRVDPKYSGRGLGVEIGKKVLDFAFKLIPTEQIKSVHLVTKKNNMPMMVTAGKLGFFIYREDESNVHYKLPLGNELDSAELWVKPESTTVCEHFPGDIPKGELTGLVLPRIVTNFFSKD